jgi:para-nitrobenzyl esterase
MSRHDMANFKSTRLLWSLYAAVLALGTCGFGSCAWSDTVSPENRPAPTAAIHVDGGRVSGSAAEGVSRYLGIPYAAAPVGALRWRAPQPAVPWEGVKAAVNFGPACLQKPSPQVPHMAEDCLTLNVFGSVKSAKRAPVMVWIYGGGFSGGASDLPSYDGSEFARSGVVFVSFNYRVGRFGFFAHPLLTLENADQGRLGNYGLMDQIAALEWVKRNITAFGGDPANVTVFGESAGGASIDALMIAPAARGLFQAAIVESGYMWRFRDLRHGGEEGSLSVESAGADFIERMGFNPSDVVALRDIPAASVNSAQFADSHGGPMRDGVVLPYDLFDAFERRLQAPVPLLLGSNEAEYPDPTAPYILHFWPDLTGESLANVLAAYGGDAALMKQNLLGDTNFAAQARYLAKMHRQAGHDAYLYRFSVLPLAAKTKLRAAPHASEIVYVFDTLATGDWPVDAKDRAVAKRMHADWVDFAKHHGRRDGLFPPYDNDDRVREYTRDGPLVHADPIRTRLDAIEASWGRP